MSQTPFHPLIEQWFRERFGEPTEAQRRGWPEERIQKFMGGNLLRVFRRITEKK